MPTEADPLLLEVSDLENLHARNCRRAAQRIIDAQRVLANELTRIAEVATRAHARLTDLEEPRLDGNAIRNLLDGSRLADLHADLREANMMASMLAESAWDPDACPQPIGI